MKSIIQILGFLICANLSATPADITVAGAVFNSWIQGQLKETNNKSDLAISGAGFFALSNGTKKIVVTRRLSLRMNSDGELVDGYSGLKLARFEESKPASIIVQNSAQKSFVGNSTRKATLIGFEVERTGAINGIYSDGSLLKIAQLQIAMFRNQRLLYVDENNKDLLNFNLRSGPPEFAAPGSHGAGLVLSATQEAIDSGYYKMNLDSI